MMPISVDRTTSLAVSIGVAYGFFTGVSVE
jgi:hypothetical protein